MSNVQIKVREATTDFTATDKTLNFDAVLKTIFSHRGLENETQLNYALKYLIPPSQMKSNMQAAELLEIAIRNQEKLLIVADFDVDGATSCTLITLALRSMGAKNVSYLVPDRFKFGYGLTPEIVDVAADQSPDIIITVDNGIASIDGVERANSLGIRVIVTDHHLPGNRLPNAEAIVNPNQQGCDFPSKSLAGVGVAFYLMLALRIKLRESGWFGEQSFKEPNLAELLDLLALGTVADIVPLDYNNRILVSQGVERIRAGLARPGINAILKVANKDFSRLTTSDLGFAVGPRLNAAGRLDDMSLGIECLLSNSESEALSMATELDQLNGQRREIESAMQKQALNILDKLTLNEEQMDNGLCLYQDNWHQGIIGLLASRIKDKVFRPVIVFANAEINSEKIHSDPNLANSNLDLEIKGSARSIPGLHMRDILDTVATKNPHLLSKFGGHAMAAGMTLLHSNLAEFKVAFNAEVTQSMKSLLNAKGQLENILWSDGELAHHQINIDTARELQDSGPWGQGFAEPRFHGEFKVIASRILSGKHLKLELENENGRAINAIAFFQDDAILNRFLDRVRILYKMDINYFRNQENLQLLIDHIKPL